MSTNSYTLSEYQKLLQAVYGARNKERSPEYLFGYLARTIGYLSKSAQHDTPESIHIMRATSWLLAIANKLDIDLEEAFISKYPGVCPYCVKSPCKCHQTGKRPWKSMAAYEVKESLRYKKDQWIVTHPKNSLKDLQELVAEIYPHNTAIVHYAGPSFILLKLHEELAEVHEAYSKYLINERKRIAVEEELADVLAWLLAAASAAFIDHDLDGDLISYYRNGCPVCLSMQCNCQDYGSRYTGLIDEASLRILATEVAHLATDAPGLKKSAELLTAAVQSGSEVASHQAVVAFIEASKSLLVSAEADRFSGSVTSALERARAIARSH